MTDPSASTSTQPNTTLYVKNLNTKTKKPELRSQLYALFSTYGKVIDVVATRADGMRGQAFVVFGDLGSATAAKRALEGFEFYRRSLKIEYARTPSKSTLLLQHGPEALFDPTFFPRASSSSSGKGKKGDKGTVTYSSAQAEQKGRERKRLREEARQRGEKVVDSDDDEEEEDDDDDDDDDDYDEEGQNTGVNGNNGEETGPPLKARKLDAASEGLSTNGPTETETNGEAEDQSEHDEEDDEDDDASEEMDMANSDSDSDGPGPGPPAP